jgi:uncharacterized protein (DUF433 family)
MSIVETEAMEPRIEGHRITVRHIVQVWIDEDRSVEEIATDVYPHLSETQVVEALRYALEHTEVLDKWEKKREQIEHEIREGAISPDDLPEEFRKEEKATA